ncbi:hypothetical protein HKX48_003164 [Thoreauomyces humboldtii]|nr:hypothetical protein HKX48_003164 [Thoreauomyces humboldtii]
MDPTARLAVNLNVLRRHDPSISQILESSSHVVVYDFDPVTKNWTKKGIEGTMFVFQRSVAPLYGLFVMNRLGLENLMVLLNADMEVQLLQEFVIYRQPDDSVQGLWMYETADRTRIVKTLTTYTELSATPQQQQQQQAPQHHHPRVQGHPQHLQPPLQVNRALNHPSGRTPTPPSTGSAGQPVDLMTLLHRAKIVGPGHDGSNGSNSPRPDPPYVQPHHQEQQFRPNPPGQGQWGPVPSSSQQQSKHEQQQSHLPHNGSHLALNHAKSVTAPPITPEQRQIQRLEDIWQWIEDMTALRVKGGLPDQEFRRRIAHLAQDNNFLDAMYRSYRWERPT